MQPSTIWPPFEEPIRRTLARNVALAAVVGVALALQRHNLKLLLPVAALALWFSLGGHYVELAFLNGLRARVPQGRLTQTLVRLVVWFSGGVLLYAFMATTARALSIHAPPLRLSLYGGFLLIGVELAVHAILAFRRLPNFYNGRG
jgi:multisubunit Na+/H+ antiporter MnhG subunit